MAAAKRYAEGTTVPADKTQAEIRALLASHDCDGFGFYEDRGGGHIQFALRGRQYRFGVDRPQPADVVMPRTNPHHRSQEELLAKAIDAEWRRRWRARLLWIKATLEFADGDEDEEGLATAMAGYLVLQGGVTVGDAITRGSLPLLGAGGGR